MNHFSHNEAIMLRSLSGIFGADNVFPMMSVLAVCQGRLPEAIVERRGFLTEWASSNKCLFTIVDAEGEARAVVEFFEGFEDSVCSSEVEHQEFLRPILKEAGIQYVTFSQQEFCAALSSDQDSAFARLFVRKLEEEGPGMGQRPYLKAAR